MAKDTFYFSHDYNARSDEKIKRLIRKHGLQGYGIYWAIIEDLYNNANAMPLDCEGIAFELRMQCEVVESVLKDFDLFVFDDGQFGSLSVQKRIDERNKKSNKARETAYKRWNKMQTYSEGNANVMPMQSKGNAIKERKGKELKERKEIFISKLSAFKERFTPTMLNEFYKYWTEHSENGYKMRFEKESTWDLELRLERWAKNEKPTVLNPSPNYTGGRKLS
jgi:hypothetical protein